MPSTLVMYCATGDSGGFPPPHHCHGSSTSTTPNTTTTAQSPTRIHRFLTGLSLRATAKRIRRQSLGAYLAERHEPATPLVPQLQPRRAQPLPQREVRHLPETVGLVVCGLQVVVRDPDAQVMHVVEADVAGEEPQHARQSEI